MLIDIYIRVSTTDQEENTSPEEQERACREFCQQKGLTVDMVHFESHTGYQYRERPKLTLMRQRIREGKIQGVVVRTLDRFTRKQVHAAILLEELEHYHCQLYSVLETEADDSVMGQFVRSVLAFVAEMEREKIMDRTIAGRIAMAKQGKIVGGKHPRYGWKWHDPMLKDYLVLNEAEAEVIRWAAHSYAEGETCVALVKTLNDSNQATPTGEGLWTPRTLRRLLTDIRNTGSGAAMFVNPSKKAKRNLEPVDLPDGTYPAIIDQETYEQILVRAKSNQEESSRNGSDPTHYLLRAGFVRCSHCKRIMVGCAIRDTRRTHPRYAYVCQKTHLCQGYRVPSPDLDLDVWNELVQLADHIGLIEQAVQLATNQDNTTANLKAVERALAEWKDKADTFNDDLNDTRLRGATRATIRKSLDDALTMVERLEGERQKLLAGEYDRQKEREAYGEILEWCKTVKTAREPLTYQKKRDFLRLLGVVVLVNRVPRKKGSDISYDIKLRLPALQELVGAKSGSFVGQSSTTMTHNDTFFIEFVRGVWRVNPALRAA